MDSTSYSCSRAADVRPEDTVTIWLIAASDLKCPAYPGRRSGTLDLGMTPGKAVWESSYLAFDA